LLICEFVCSGGGGDGGEDARLRYLEFVQQAAAQAVVLAAAAYAYAWQDAGPLRPCIDHVEGTVKAVVGPV
jgi:hypothetical protein